MSNKLYLEAPNYHKPEEIRNFDCSIFLGGSITGAHDWQKEVSGKLLNHFHVFNPRRNNYTPTETEERNQIGWEYFFLNKADIILFYFSYETLAPITLFEYGKFLGRNKYASWQKIYPCIHPDYKRKNDVIIQTELENQLICKNITFNLNECIEKIIQENI